MVADGRLQDFVYQVGHAADHGDYIRGLRVRYVDLDLQVDSKGETLATLGLDLLKLTVEVVRLRDNVGPVQRNDERWHDHGLVRSRIEDRKSTRLNSSHLG